MPQVAAEVELVEVEGDAELSISGGEVGSSDESDAEFRPSEARN